MTSPWPGSRSVLRAGALRPLGDGKKGKLQIVHVLLCAADGCPVAVGVFEGITADPMTLATQIDKLKEPFGLSRVVLVGDRRHDHQCPHPRRVGCKEIRHEHPAAATNSVWPHGGRYWIQRGVAEFHPCKICRHEYVDCPQA